MLLTHFSQRYPAVPEQLEVARRVACAVCLVLCVLCCATRAVWLVLCGLCCVSRAVCLVLCVVLCVLLCLVLCVLLCLVLCVSCAYGVCDWLRFGKQEVDVLDVDTAGRACVAFDLMTVSVSVYFT